MHSHQPSQRLLHDSLSAELRCLVRLLLAITGLNYEHIPEHNMLQIGLMREQEHPSPSQSIQSSMSAHRMAHLDWYDFTMTPSPTREKFETFVRQATDVGLDYLREGFSGLRLEPG